MGETNSSIDEGGTPEETDEPAELRTISFRLREIQRLLAIRVEQENRRLEADGLEPVSESRILEDDVVD